jgi:hypothetical protein
MLGMSLNVLHYSYSIREALFREDTLIQEKHSLLEVILHGRANSIRVGV